MTAIARRLSARPRARPRSRTALLAADCCVPSLVIFAAFFFYPLYRLVLPGPPPAEPLRHGRALRRAGSSTPTCSAARSSATACSRRVGTCCSRCRWGSCSACSSRVSANRRLRGIKVFQTIFSSTVATSVAVASVIFLVLINPQVGYFRDIGVISLTDPATALRGVALSSVWQNLGLTFVIVLAGLQAVPDEIYEAATLDGYGPFRRFFKRHPAADLAHADVPRRGARGVRPAGVRPGRHPHRRRPRRIDRDAGLQDLRQPAAAARSASAR